MSTINYKQQAIDFLKKTGTRMYIEHVGCHPCADWEDNEPRDHYAVTLYKYKPGSICDKLPFDKTNEKPFAVMREYKFTFKDSLANTAARQKRRVYDNTVRATGMGFGAKPGKWSKPSPYDILACLTSYDPGLFEDFCSDYGYEKDSRKAYKVYESVRDEYLHLARLFSDSELKLLGEIN